MPDKGKKEGQKKRPVGRPRKSESISNPETWASKGESAVVGKTWVIPKDSSPKEPALAVSANQRPDNNEVEK